MRSVTVKWNLKCNSISAVPLGFNVSYCKSILPDFGHCQSIGKSLNGLLLTFYNSIFLLVEHQVVNSPLDRSLVIQDLDAGDSYIFSVSVLSLIGEGRTSVPKLITLAEESKLRINYVSRFFINFFLNFSSQRTSSRYSFRRK